MPKKRKYNTDGPKFPPKLVYLDEDGNDIIEEIFIKDVSFNDGDSSTIINIDFGEYEGDKHGRPFKINCRK